MVDDDDMFDGGEYNDEDEEDVMTFGDDEEGAAPPNFVQGVLNQMNAEWEDGGDDGEEDGCTWTMNISLFGNPNEISLKQSKTARMKANLSCSQWTN